MRKLISLSYQQRKSSDSGKKMLLRRRKKEEKEKKRGKKERKIHLAQILYPSGAARRPYEQRKDSQTLP